MVFIYRLAPPMLLIMVWYVWGLGWPTLSTGSIWVPPSYMVQFLLNSNLQIWNWRAFISVPLRSSNKARPTSPVSYIQLANVPKTPQEQLCLIQFFQENMKNQKPAVALLQLHFKKRGWKRLFENYTTYPACCKFTRFQLSFKKKFFSGKPFKRQNFVDMDSENP